MRQRVSLVARGHLLGGKAAKISTALFAAKGGVCHSRNTALDKPCGWLTASASESHMEQAPHNPRGLQLRVLVAGPYTRLPLPSVCLQAVIAC